MLLHTAVNLIQKGVDTNQLGQTWADLGAGTGLFSQALSTLLDPSSAVYAIDKDRGAMANIAYEKNAAPIHALHLDFVHDPIIIAHPIAGIMMANSLHYVRNKEALIHKMTNLLRPQGRIIVVEYDQSMPNPWVPYPIKFEKLVTLSRKCGFKVCEKIGEHPSSYGNRMIYAALLS